MENTPDTKQYDLEERSLQFAKSVRNFVKRLKKDINSLEDSKQLIRSSGSIGANYIEANESFSKKDFFFRLKISRKEARESRYWLNLLDSNGDELIERERLKLIQESTELTKILSSIIQKANK